MTLSYLFDTELFKLGKPCKKRHCWYDSGLCLRYKKDGRCVICERSRRQGKSVYNPEKAREYYLRKCQEPGWKDQKRAYMRLVSSKPEHVTKRRERNEKAREANRQAGLTSDGSPRKRQKATRLQSAIRNAGRLPTVQQLVIAEQLRYWKENPAEAKRKKTERARERRLWRYKTDARLRLYNREKSKRRKAKLRGSVGVQVTPDEIRYRFNQFDDRCAYCGSTGDLHIEHVMPIAKGGNHVLSNILPACQRCNYSKRTHPVEDWYRSQAFFSASRWAKIRHVLGLRNGSVNQLSLV